MAVRADEIADGNLPGYDGERVAVGHEVRDVSAFLSEMVELQDDRVGSAAVGADAVGEQP